MVAPRFFGFTRFSTFMPGSGAWKVSQAGALTDEESYRKYLYSDERMLPRFQIFCDWALPIYQQMAESHEYRHVLQYSESMPEPWKRRLREAAMAYPVLLLEPVTDSIDGRPTMERELSKSTKSGPVVWFRVDDDDILPTSYLDQISQYAHSSYFGMAVSLSYGIAGVYDGGRFSNLRFVRRPLLSQGQAYVGYFTGHDRRLLLPPTASHSRTDQHMPVILDSRAIGYLWTHHALQDTKSTVSSEVARNRINLSLSRWEPVSKAIDLAGAFPTLEKQLEDIDAEASNNVIFQGRKQILDSTLHFGVNVDHGTPVSVFYAIEGVPGLPSRPSGAIMMFEFSGGPAPESVEGLNRSKDPSIGWFRYLRTSSEWQSGEVVFHLPEGVGLSAIRIKLWNEKAGEVVLRQLRLAQS